MNLVQFLQNQRLAVAIVVDPHTLQPLTVEGGTRALALTAAREGTSLIELIEQLPKGPTIGYQQVVDEQRLLPPLTHPDPAHTLVSGTGLTHLGSAASRAAMHAKAGSKAELTDSMRMFQGGVEGGKPPAGDVGFQPEWFYKGDGGIVVNPGQPLPAPAFAQDAGEEPELVGLYVIGDDGLPLRVGHAIGNEFSDHVTERFNYLWLAHSKLRCCSYGPELRLGELPTSLVGRSRILRDGRLLWEQPFLTGEANMSHTLANLEHHHFKYAQFRRPGDVHVHYFGTATLSFADSVRTQPGDAFEIVLPGFGRALRNAIAWSDEAPCIAVKAL